MKLTRVIALFIARSKEFYRDPAAMLWTILFPVLMIVAFGYMFDFDTEPKLKLGLVAVEKDYEDFDEIYFQDKKSALNSLEKHGVDIVFDGKTYFVNETSPKAGEASLMFEGTLARQSNLFLAQRSVISTVKYGYVDWLLAGLLTLNASWGALFGIGWVVVRHRKLDVLKRLSASPVRASEYLLANMLSRVVVIVLTGVLVYGISLLVYPFSMKGSFLEFFFVYGLGALSLASLGLIVAARSRSEEFASGILQFVNYPLIFISEVFFSLEGSPDWVKDIAFFSPLFQTTDLMRKIMLEGQSLFDYPAELSVLLLTSLVFIAAGSLMFRWTS